MTVPLKRPVAPNQIKSIGLVHLAGGGYALRPQELGALATPAGPALAPIYAAQGVKSEDNWDMAEFQASAIGNNVPIASFGVTGSPAPIHRSRRCATRSGMSYGKSGQQHLVHVLDRRRRPPWRK